VELDRVRAASLKLPIDVDWKAASETARRATVGQPGAADVPLIL
jgi:hypothetical protein